MGVPDRLSPGADPGRAGVRCSRGCIMSGHRQTPSPREATQPEEEEDTSGTRILLHSIFIHNFCYDLAETFPRRPICWPLSVVPPLFLFLKSHRRPMHSSI